MLYQYIPMNNLKINSKLTITRGVNVLLIVYTTPFSIQFFPLYTLENLLELPASVKHTALPNF